MSWFTELLTLESELIADLQSSLDKAETLRRLRIEKQELLKEEILSKLSIVTALPTTVASWAEVADILVDYKAGLATLDGLKNSAVFAAKQQDIKVLFNMMFYSPALGYDYWETLATVILAKQDPTRWAEAAVALIGYYEKEGGTWP